MKQETVGEPAIDGRTLRMLEHALTIARNDLSKHVAVVYLYTSDYERLMAELKKLGATPFELVRISLHKCRSYWDLESLCNPIGRDAQKEVFLVDPTVIEEKFQHVLGMLHRYDLKG